MEKLTPLPCSGLLHIKDRKLLLAFSRNKQCFYLPGGKTVLEQLKKAGLID
jgi:hypothetical protein